MCQGPTLEERTRCAAGAAIEFAVAASRVQNEELRSASLQLMHEGLAAWEEHGKHCALCMLEALQSAAAAGSYAMHDALWMLQQLAERSASSKSWILCGRGVEVVHCAIVAAPGDEKFAQSGAWLVYTLDGLKGLTDLLWRSRSGSSAGHAAVRVAVAWAVFELVRGQRAEAGGSGSQPQPESASVLSILVDAMELESMSLEGKWACVAAVDAMVKGEARLGSLFLERGGARLVARALRAAATMGRDAEELRRALAYLVTSLADGSTQAVSLLCAEGAMASLAEVSLQGSGLEVEATMWALGSLGGIGAVLDVMSKQQATGVSHAMRGGVLALSQCAWNAVGDQEELSRLPVALALLLDFMAHEETLSAASGDGSSLRVQCVVALGSVLASLVTHAPPNRHGNVDRGVEVLLTCLQTTPVLSASSNASAGATAASDTTCGASGAVADAAASFAAEKAAEAIGRIALASVEWRQALRQCGALEALAGWIHCREAPLRLQQYLFWAAAAIAGLQFVSNEMRLHMASADAVHAGLCTIIDILDDDVEDEYASVGAERSRDADMPALLGLVLEAMRTHPGALEVQEKACSCVGLLVRLVTASRQGGVPAGCVAAVAAAVAPVVAAARRFARCPEVVRGVCAALRALLGVAPLCLDSSHCPSSPSDDGQKAALACALSEEGAVDFADEACDAFATTPHTEDLLEDAIAVVALGRGFRAVLPKLDAAPPGSLLRVAGLKALFELGRGDLRLMGQACRDAGVVQAIADMCAKLAAEEAGTDQCGRISESAALLMGLCGCAPMHVSRAGT
mmetsp:Transcript_17676/g.61909  ORF Transcript_17676/g.61909 Transcript_17676/m.61909 type:complete len:802 (+) Transcript_17676:49-2454(+)